MIPRIAFIAILPLPLPASLCLPELFFLSFSLDVRRSDDRPPLLDLGLLEGAERRRRLLLCRRNLLSHLDQPLAQHGIGQGRHRGGIESVDESLGRAGGGEQSVPERGGEAP